MIKKSLRLCWLIPSVLLISLSACAAQNQHNWTIHARSFGKSSVDKIRVSGEGFYFTMGDISSIAMREASDIPSPAWPTKINVEWIAEATGKKLSRTIDVPPPPPMEAHDWYLVLLFFDDDLILKSLSEITHWDPVLKGFPHYYGDDIEQRIKAEKSSDAPTAPSK